MIVYLLKSIACLLLLLLVHRLLLQREVLHRFNRFFLLFSVVASFLIPLYTIEVTEEIAAAPVEVNAEPVYFEAGQSEVISEPVYIEAESQGFNQDQVLAAIPESQFNWESLLFGLYGLISLVFFFRFVRNIKILVNKIQRNIKINYRDQTLVLLKEESLPFSFLKYIFVAESDLENGKFTDAVFAHECTHIQEKHSWDNLFIEILLVPFWFHPGLYWAKAAIKLNHEFIADEVALRSTPIEKYESQLLAMMLSEQKYGLASNLNFSLTKKRFEMMKRKSVNSNTWIKVFALVPILGALVYFFSERVAAQAEKSITEVYVNASKEGNLDFDLVFSLKANGVIISEGAEYNLEEIKALILERKAAKNDLKINLITDAGLKMGDLGDFQAVLRHLDIRRISYNSNHQEDIDESNGKNYESDSYRMVGAAQVNVGIVAQPEEKEEYYRNASIFVEDESGEFISKSYRDLSEFEKSLLVSPPKTPVKSTPTTSEFNSWKNSNDFALWLDGKVLPNSQLDGMSITEIDFFISSFVQQNARADKFPQEHQVNMYTKAGFEKTYGAKSGFKTPLVKEDRIIIHPLAKRVNYSRTIIKEGQDPVAMYVNLYNEYVTKFEDKSEEELTESEQIEAWYIFSELGGRYFRLTAENKKKVQRTKRLLLSPMMRLERNGKIYYKKLNELNDDERQNVVPPPPPPPDWKTIDSSKNPADHNLTSDPVAEQKEETADKSPPAVKTTQIKIDLQVYIDAHSAYEKLRKQAPHFVNRSKAEQEKLTEMYSELGSMYFQVAFYDKPKVRRAVLPYVPYFKLASKGEVYYKKAKDLTAEELSILGPPPPPPTPEEQLEAYKKVYYKYELMRNKGRNDASLSMKEREAMFLLYNELQLKFLTMNAPERRQVKMVNFPYIPIEENGELVFKAKNELSPEQKALNNC